HAVQLVLEARTPTRAAAQAELLRGLGGMLGQAPVVKNSVSAHGAILAGTPASSPPIAQLDLDLRALGQEGYLIRSLMVNGRATTVIAANSDIGVLYGAFRLLRLVQTGVSLQHVDLTDAPRVKVRVLDHWDNLDGRVE